jgi:NTE family protein
MGYPFTIGLALGSGSARGWAHIGVIKALARMGIEPNIICGTSVGALVGAAYATGKLDHLETWARELTPKSIARYALISIGGGAFLSSDKLFPVFGEEVGAILIEALPKKFAAVATDLDSGEEVWIRKGALIDAVAPSIALPGLFSPVAFGKRWLVDGGLVNPVPITLARAMGAEIVIAVNLNGDLVRRVRERVIPPAPVSVSRQDTEDREISFWENISGQFKSRFQNGKGEVAVKDSPDEVPRLLKVLASSINIMQDRITRSRMAGDPPDIVLSPRLSELGLLDFHRASEAIREGEDCVERMVPVINDALFWEKEK